MAKQKLTRISITLPEETLQALDIMVDDQGFDSRSQALVDMINHRLIAQQAISNAVMVGTLTLLYDRNFPNIRIQIGDLQHQYLEQVISSLTVQLDQDKVLEVMLLQGVSTELDCISQQFIAIKGVIKGHLELMDAVMPPLQQNE
ncbi:MULTISPECIES: CopG family ribbon-helix-helix protein [Acinetobacter]|jgi:CopG family nickel-responsive transcriptional regulator|uniref:Transcriptional regulator n=2 Tax=Acinetobacter TaxID=469 RepID=A0A1Z9YY65_9GAMM|nr:MULTISPECIES: ribbon-helix-helix protein, CopG family [Acinetobacter]MCH4247174.1 ribbon-helix-helix protein, CopG family [Acinetobacter populi]OUY07140.1 transcriptional regulator [Acinetobacter populi]SNX43944.1 CopG family transcriptional regulator, nickel-responsive regulator [Acinetobacter puyangensis]